MLAEINEAIRMIHLPCRKIARSPRISEERKWIAA
jgi:hypothetical protein